MRWPCWATRRAALANDLTKMFERVDRGTLSELLKAVEQTSMKGEYVLVIEGKHGLTCSDPSTGSGQDLTDLNDLTALTSEGDDE